MCKNEFPLKTEPLNVPLIRGSYLPHSQVTDSGQLGDKETRMTGQKKEKRRKKQRNGAEKNARKSDRSSEGPALACLFHAVLCRRAKGTFW